TCRADYLIAWDAVDSFGVCPHEILATTGNDESLVAVGAQVLHDFEHRLKHQIGVEALKARVLRRRDPIVSGFLEHLHRRAGVSEGDNLQEFRYPQLPDSRAVA